MSNIICYTQDVPGEREWINSQFPKFTNLETESSGNWATADSLGDLIWEIPYTDSYDVNFIKNLNGTLVKTIYRNDIDTVIHDNDILSADQLLINSKIKFLNNININIKSYSMFTFARCGSIFTESLLKQKYPPTGPHYGMVGIDKINAVKSVSLDLTTRVCLNYRSNWWSWLTSHAIRAANTELTDRGVLHYNDNVDWNNDVCSTIISSEFIDEYEAHLINTFNFWIQLRIMLPEHQFSLFRFEDIVAVHQSNTNHKQIPYDKVKLIENYLEIKQIFDSKYLPRWQSIENKALNFLKQLNVSPTTVI
jgi:hypothetical protein